MSKHQDEQLARGLEHFINKTVPVSIDYGVVTSVLQDGTATVRINGSSTFKTASVPRNIDVKLHDHVILAIPQSQVQPIVVVAYSNRFDGLAANTQERGDNIAPPLSINVIERYPNLVGIQWEVPSGLPLAFDIEFDIADTEAEISSPTLKRISDSIYVEQASGTGITYWFRVRSISESGKESGWSSWYSATSSGGSTAEDIPAGFFDTAVVVSGEIVRNSGVPIWANV
jgi:hypothetical protein